MKTLQQHISEKLVLNNNNKIRKYNYHPKTKDELKELIEQLIEERGNKADLNDIDVSEMTDLSFLFNTFTEFNGDISEWDVSNVTVMDRMFAGSEFNGDLSKWDVSNVKNMECMFSFSNFTGENGDLSKWDVGNVDNMSSMFYKTSFNGDISKWEIKKNCYVDDMFGECPIKEEYKPKFKN